MINRSKKTGTILPKILLLRAALGFAPEPPSETVNYQLSTVN